MVTNRKDKQPAEPALSHDPIQAAIDYGIDIQALMDNLKRTPTERIRRHQIALDTLRMLQKARRV
jgi:hypothetical protein